MERAKMPASMVAELVRSKEQYYEAMERNDFLLPSIHSSIVTMTFLQDVRAGVVFCPKAGKHPMPKKVVSKPTIDHLASYFIRYVQGKYREDGTAEEMQIAAQLYKLILYFQEGKLPDREWLIFVISIFTPWASIFDKSYVFVKPEK